MYFLSLSRQIRHGSVHELWITLNAYKSIKIFFAYDRAGQTLSNKLVNNCSRTLQKKLQLVPGSVLYRVKTLSPCILRFTLTGHCISHKTTKQQDIIHVFLNLGSLILNFKYSSLFIQLRLENWLVYLRVYNQIKIFASNITFLCDRQTTIYYFHELLFYYTSTECLKDNADKSMTFKATKLLRSIRHDVLRSFWEVTKIVKKIIWEFEW